MANTKLIGTAPNQVPTNADLGSMAFQDADAVRVGTLRSDGKVIVGSTYSNLEYTYAAVTSDQILLDVQSSSNDAYIRIMSQASGDSDAILICAANGTGESGINFINANNALTTYSGLRGYIINRDGNWELEMYNATQELALYLGRVPSDHNDGGALTLRGDSGIVTVTGVTGTIVTSSTGEYGPRANTYAITGLSSFASLYNNMGLTKTAGTGVLGADSYIVGIDATANVVIVHSSATSTNGSITFTATPRPVTFHILSSGAGTWTSNTEFSRIAFGNEDADGAGTGGIKAAIAAFVDNNTTAGNTGLRFYTSNNGTSMSAALILDSSNRMYANGSFQSPAVAVAALSVNCASGNYFTKTISANSTFTFDNPPITGNAYCFTMELTHTSGAVTWPATVKWNDDRTPVLTTGKTHLFMFVTDNGGTRWRGSALTDYVN